METKEIIRIHNFKKLDFITQTKYIKNWYAVTILKLAFIRKESILGYLKLKIIQDLTSERDENMVVSIWKKDSFFPSNYIYAEV